MPNTGDVREECYERMMQAMKDGIAMYYKRFPERWDDRAVEALECSARGLEVMLKILDEYDIRRK
jgi:hypothetical protein